MAKQEIKYVCLNCGAPVPESKGSRRRVYCGQKCQDRYYYTTTPRERDQRRQKLKEEKVSSAYKKTYTCQYCGESFEDYIHKHRKYCSRKCSDAAHSYEGAGCRAELKVNHVPMGSDIREEALRLHAEGKTTSEISNCLSCSHGTVISWIKHTQKRESEFGSHRALKEPYFRYIYANNAEIWRKILRDEMKKRGFSGGERFKKSVLLICGTMNIHKGADALVTIVSEKLKMDPFDGNYYAFCGNERDKMRILQWDGCGFQVTSRRREQGLYVWPPTRFGAIVKVTAREFEFLLHGSQKPIIMMS